MAGATLTMEDLVTLINCSEQEFFIVVEFEEEEPVDEEHTGNI